MNTYPEVLDRLIYDELLRPSTYDELSSVVNKLKNETDRLKRYLPGILSTEKSHEPERYIQAIQRQLLCWMEAVYDYLPEHERRRLNEFSNEWTDAYKTVYRYLEEVLDVIKRNFKRFIDLTCIIPRYRLMEAQDKVTNSIQLIEQRPGKSDIDPTCKEIILKPLYNFIATDVAEHTVTYADLLYIDELHTGLTDFFTRHSGDDTFRQLHKYLIYLNFNDVDYFRHAARLMKRELSGYVTSKFRLIKLYKYEAYNNQLPVKADVAYRREERSQKQLLKEWITDEINLVKQNAAVEEAPPLPADFAKLFNVKVFLDLSADEISCLFGLLFKNGIIIKEKVVKNRLMELAAYFIATKRMEKLSAESLRKKMYNPPAAVLSSVKEILKDLMNQTL